MTAKLMDEIHIPIVNGFIVKQVNHIIRVQASSNYSRIYCTDERYPITVAKVLAWFQLVLPPQDFIRTHRTHLINKQFIERKIGNQMLMRNGEIISISKRKLNKLKNIC